MSKPNSKRAAGHSAEQEMALTLHPRENLNFFGHHATLQSIEKSINSPRLSQAILLSGKTGIGKASLGYLIARSMLVQNNIGGPITLLRDQSIESYSQVAKQVASGSHPELIVLDPDQESVSEKKTRIIDVTEIRQLREQLTLKLRRDAWRVVIIDNADSMNRSAQNALLKVLEEPPQKSLFILTSNRETLLPTVKSRCARIKMSPLNLTDTTDALAAAGRSDLVQNSKLLAISAGSPGLACAYSALDNAAFDLAEKYLKAVLNQSSSNIGVLANQLAATIARARNETATQLWCSWWLSQLREIARSNAGNPAGDLARDTARNPAGNPDEQLASQPNGESSIKPDLANRFARAYASTLETVTTATEFNLDVREMILQVLAQVVTHVVTQVVTHRDHTQQPR